MGVRDLIEGKRQWRAHQARVRALPREYRIVYREIQKYCFTVCPVGIADGPLLPELVDLFEQGAAAGTDVLALIGTDVAAFCDELIGARPGDSAP